MAEKRESFGKIGQLLDSLEVYSPSYEVKDLIKKKITDLNTKGYKVSSVFVNPRDMHQIFFVLRYMGDAFNVELQSAFEGTTKKRIKQVVDTITVYMPADNVKDAVSDEIVKKNDDGYKIVVSFLNPLDPQQIIFISDYIGKGSK